MPTRRDLFKQAGAVAALAALHPVVARAQARKPTLTVGYPSTPETIDPHQFRSVLSGSIIGLMGEGLLTRDPQTMELKPLLAESWRNVNPTTWEVKAAPRDQVPQRRGVHGRVRQVHHRARHHVQAEHAGQADVAAHLRPGDPGRRSAHRAYHDQD